MPPSEQTNPSVQNALDAADKYREVIEKLRGRADIAAKSFGTLATTAVTAVGIAKLGDVFPYQAGLGWWVALGAVGFTSVLVAVGFLTARLWRVSQPIPTRTDPNLMDPYLRGDEKQLVRDVYDESARLNGVRNLRAYEARGHRLERIADDLDEKSAKRLLDRAVLIRAEIKAVTARAAALVVRQRSERVIISPWTLIPAALFVAGIVAFAVSADRLDSARDGEIKVAKACAEARTAKATETLLPLICGDADSDPAADIALRTSEVTLATNAVALAKACVEARGVKAAEDTLPEECGNAPEISDTAMPTPTGDDIADKAFVALAQAWLDCRTALRKANSSSDTCTGIARAMTAILQGRTS